MAETQERELLTISVIKFTHRGTYGMLVSCNERHAVMPWEYGTAEEATYECTQFFEVFTAMKAAAERENNQPSFDFPTPEQGVIEGGEIRKIGGED